MSETLNLDVKTYIFLVVKKEQNKKDRSAMQNIFGIGAITELLTCFVSVTYFLASNVVADLLFLCTVMALTGDKYSLIVSASIYCRLFSLCLSISSFQKAN